MSNFRRWATLGAITLGCFAFAAAPAKANLLPFLSTTSPNLDGTTTFNYSVSLSTDERIDGAGSGYTAFFTIYDFAGYVAGSIVAPTNWSASAQLVGQTPVGVTVPDDPNVWNLTFTYTGAATITGIGQTFTGFSAESIYSQVNNNGAFSQQSTKNAGPSSGGRDFGAGPESVPMSSVPEPSTLLMLGTGIALLSARLIARKRVA